MELKIGSFVDQINPNSLADQAGLQVGDVIIKIGEGDADLMRHKEAQDAIVSAGNYLTMTVQRFLFVLQFD